MGFNAVCARRRALTVVRADKAVGWRRRPRRIGPRGRGVASAARVRPNDACAQRGLLILCGGRLRLLRAPVLRSTRWDGGVGGGGLLASHSSYHPSFPRVSLARGSLARSLAAAFFSLRRRQPMSSWGVPRCVRPSRPRLSSAQTRDRGLLSNIFPHQT